MKQALFPQKKPKILLINFSPDDAKELGNKGYNVEEGTLTGAVYHFPSPSYEYDIVIARLDTEGFELANTANSERSYNEREDFRIMKERMAAGGFAIVFNGDGGLNIADFEACGIDKATPLELDSRDTQYDSMPLPSATPPWTGRAFVASLIEKFSQYIERPVTTGVEFRTTDSKPIVSLAGNRAGQSIAVMAFSTKYGPKQPAVHNFLPPVVPVLGYRPDFIILPALTEGYIRVVNEIFSQLPSWRPDLFPTADSQNWIESKGYWSEDMKKKEEKVIEEKLRSEQVIREREAEFSKSYAADEMMRLLITADDSEDYPEDKNLTSAALFALKTLGFEVEKREEELRDGKRREDLMCIDGEYVAVVECKGTVVVNPPEKYHGQILQHLVSTKGAITQGILIVNSDRKRDAFSRTPLYEGEGQFWETSQNITVLSTVDLYRLCRAVSEGELSAADARELIKKPGRVEYPPRIVKKA